MPSRRYFYDAIDFMQIACPSFLYGALIVFARSLRYNGQRGESNGHDKKERATG